jgi:hypothetical protein
MASFGRIACIQYSRHFTVCRRVTNVALVLGRDFSSHVGQRTPVRNALGVLVGPYRNQIHLGWKNQQTVCVKIGSIIYNVLMYVYI